jgi:hypothetical protein
MAAFELEMWSAVRHGRVLTRAGRSPVRELTRCMRVVLMASGRVIVGRMMVAGSDRAPGKT